MGDSDSIMYLPPGSKVPPRNSSFPLITESNFMLFRPQKTGLLRGPRRVARLCLFALVLPSIFITIPLYVRLVLYPPGHYSMMPTDQRLLNRHVSSVWCQAQSTHMNGSFNAFLSPHAPSLGLQRRRYVMLDALKLRDDVKEYWGFYFLKGSTITISSCSRWEGGQLMILRGVENLHRCAWIGEEDSTEMEEEEEDDAASEERHKRDRYRNREQSSSLPTEQMLKNSEERQKDLAGLLRKAIKLSKDKKEILKILHNEEGKQRDYLSEEMEMTRSKEDENRSDNNFLTNLSDMLSDIDNNTVPTMSLSTGTEPSPIKDVDKKDRISEPSRRKLRGEIRKGQRRRLDEKRRRRRRKKKDNRRNENLTEEENEESVLSRLRRNVEYEDDPDGAFEENDAQEDIVTQASNQTQQTKMSFVESAVGGQVYFPEGLKFERGKFNQSSVNDKSHEEHKSSYSSSEEALASCEGVILALPLMPYRNCDYKAMTINKIIYDIPVTGTYYFVFSSDNELHVNDMYFNLTMERVVYDTEEYESKCSNSSDCSFPLSFWSNQQTVVEVPQEASWDRAYVLDTKCEPRVYIYLIFILLAPLFILFCAFQ